MSIVEQIILYCNVVGNNLRIFDNNNDTILRMKTTENKATVIDHIISLIFECVKLRGIPCTKFSNTHTHT